MATKTTVDNSPLWGFKGDIVEEMPSAVPAWLDSPDDQSPQAYIAGVSRIAEENSERKSFRMKVLLDSEYLPERVADKLASWEEENGKVKTFYLTGEFTNRGTSDQQEMNVVAVQD